MGRNGEAVKRKKRSMEKYKIDRAILQYSNTPLLSKVLP